MIPKSITLSKNRENLILEWEGDHARALPAHKLRAAARLADEVRAMSPDTPMSYITPQVNILTQQRIKALSRDQS